MTELERHHHARKSGVEQLVEESTTRGPTDRLDARFDLDFLEKQIN
jgi:hypothetical protein